MVIPLFQNDIFITMANGRTTPFPKCNYKSEKKECTEFKHMVNTEFNFRSKKKII
jgi:hypothetical protein